MFVMSKRNFLVPRADGTRYMIRKDYIGDIPEDVANSWLVQAAIKDGGIATPSSHLDGDLRASSDKADKISAEHDKRPDSPRKRTKKA